jgi:hypothetical protein
MTGSERNGTSRGDSLREVFGRLRRFLSGSNEGGEPGGWRLTERAPQETRWYNDETNQFVVCTRHREGAWTAKAKPALVDGEEVDLSLTAGPTSREIAEYLAEQYMNHELVLAPVTAMGPRRTVA